MEATPITEPDLEHSVGIDAPPGTVYELVSDVPRTPEWSPVVKKSEWLAGATRAETGARFVGHNRFNGFRWSRECRVSEAQPGRVFAFSTFGKHGEEQTRWRYEIEPEGDGSRVALAYEIVTTPRWVRFLRKLPGGRSTNERQARQNVEASLQRLHDLLVTSNA